MHRLIPAALLCLIFTAIAGCKTSEANYRAAYERAVAGRDSTLGIDSTIYGNVRRQMDTRTATLADGSTVDIYGQHVRMVEGTGAPDATLRRYNVVVGRFKQLFNARSMRNRLAEGGIFPGAFVVKTAEPYHYVVAASYASLDSAAAALRNMPDGVPPMRPPLPFILDATSCRQ